MSMFVDVITFNPQGPFPVDWKTQLTIKVRVIMKQMHPTSNCLWRVRLSKIYRFEDRLYGTVLHCGFVQASSLVDPNTSVQNDLRISN